MKQENSSMKIEETIKKLDDMVEQLKDIFEAAEKGGFDPFIEITYKDVTDFKEELLVMLQEYQYYKSAFEDGNIFIKTDGPAVQMNRSSRWSGENAPAYKESLNGEEMYQLWKRGVSMNEIAKRFRCSPDTVKRRILKIQQREKEDARTGKGEYIGGYFPRLVPPASI